jgi:hypothetical protein
MKVSAMAKRTTAAELPGPLGWSSAAAGQHDDSGQTAAEHQEGARFRRGSHFLSCDAQSSQGVCRCLPLAGESCVACVGLTLSNDILITAAHGSNLVRV